MKRVFNVFDGLFLLGLYFKLSGTGPALQWWEVFAPYALEAVGIAIRLWLSTYSFGDRLAFVLFKWKVTNTMRQASKDAEKQVKKAFYADMQAELERRRKEGVADDGTK